MVNVRLWNWVDLGSCPNATSVPCMVEKKARQLALTELLGLQCDACLVGNIKACNLSPTVYYIS